MKILMIKLLIILSYFSIHSQEPPFRVQRMLTDFKGIVTNGKKTICYGNYGIITFSTDAGQSWEQINVGDKYNIIKIETDGDEFYGTTDYFLFRTYNHDTYWLKQSIFEESKISDMTLYNDKWYLLNNNGIYLADKDMNVATTPFLNLDSNSKYSELKTDGINLYFIYNDTLLLIYNLNSKNADTIDLIKDIDCFNCIKKVSHIKIFDDKVYILVSQKSSYNSFDSYIMKSGDYGKTWEKLTQQIKNAECFKIIDNDVYILNTIYNNKIYIQDTINLLDTMPQRFINYDDKIYYSDFVFINEDNIIAAGSNKMISVSYNKGKSFEFKSFFGGVYDGYPNVQFLSDSLIYVVNGYSFNKTTNGGITWLPQNYSNYHFRDSNDNYVLFYSYPNFYYFDINGKGFAKYDTINKNDYSNVLVTDDYGENFYKTNEKDLKILTTSPLQRKGIDLGDVILFILGPTKDSSGKYSYLILRYDKSIKLIDSLTLKTDSIRNIVRIDDNNIIALNLRTSGDNLADSTGKTKDYSYNYYYIKSTDKGRTWDDINVNVKIPQKLQKNFYTDDFSYYDILTRVQFIYNNYVLYPSTENIIYKYDFVNNQFDSLFYPATISQFEPNSPIFKYWNKLFMFSFAGNNKIYFTNDLDSYNPKWDTLESGELFQQWDNFSPPYTENMDAILSSNMLNDSTGFLVIGKSKRDYPGWKFKVNFAKILWNPLVKVDDNKIETERVLLWNSPPYPIPGTNIIKSDIYWNKFYKIEDAKINVYDIQGFKLNNNNIVIEPRTTYSGILKWDCSNINNGIYIIQIKLSGGSISFPVIISR